jgi:hypothetical protein
MNRRGPFVNPYRVDRGVARDVIFYDWGSVVIAAGRCRVESPHGIADTLTAFLGIQRSVLLDLLCRLGKLTVLDDVTKPARIISGAEMVLPCTIPCAASALAAAALHRARLIAMSANMIGHRLSTTANNISVAIRHSSRSCVAAM